MLSLSFPFVTYLNLRCPQRHGPTRQNARPHESASQMKLIQADQQSSQRRSVTTFHSCIPFLQTRKRARVNPCHSTMSRRGCWRWWWTKGRMSFSLELLVRGDPSTPMPPFMSPAYPLADPDVFVDQGLESRYCSELSLPPSRRNT